MENDRVKELMSELLNMRKRLKKEEEQRRQFVEIARKKEEEIKKLRQDVVAMEKKFQDEGELK